MKPTVVRLGTVVVEGKVRDLALQKEDFYGRQRAAGGFFLPPEEVEKWRGGRTSTLLRLVPGAQVVAGRAGTTQVLFRSGMTWCTPALYIDGVHLPFDGFIDDFLPITNVKAVEVYRGVNTPARFRGLSDQCGALVFWSGAEPPPKPKKARKRASDD